MLVMFTSVILRNANSLFLLLLKWGINNFGRPYDEAIRCSMIGGRAGTGKCLVWSVVLDWDNPDGSRVLP